MAKKLKTNSSTVLQSESPQKPKMVEVELSDSERKAVMDMSSEINQGLMSLGILEMQKRDHEVMILQRKEKINQILKDKVSLAGHSNAKHIEPDLQNGILRVTLG